MSQFHHNTHTHSNISEDEQMFKLSSIDFSENWPRVDRRHYNSDVVLTVHRR